MLLLNYWSLYDDQLIHICGLETEPAKMWKRLKTVHEKTGVTGSAIDLWTQFHTVAYTDPSTVPFWLIHQSRVTGPSGPALILVHVTGHIDFGRMGKMVQNKSFNYLRYISFYGYDIWLSLSQINFLLVANSVCHRSYRKWSQCQNATAVSQVTPPDESIEMVQYSTSNSYFYKSFLAGALEHLHSDKPSDTQIIAWIFTSLPLSYSTIINILKNSDKANDLDYITGLEPCMTS